MRPLLAKCYDGSYIFKIKTSTYTMSQERRNINLFLMLCRGYAWITVQPHQHWPTGMIVALRTVVEIPSDFYDRLSTIHNSIRGHGGLKLCKKRLKKIHKRRLKMNLEPAITIPYRMIIEFIWQYLYCQISGSCRSTNQRCKWKWVHTCYHWCFFQMGRIIPHQIDHTSWNCIIILNHIGRFGSPEVIHTDQGPAFHNELVTELFRLCGNEQFKRGERYRGAYQSKGINTLKGISLR